MPQDPRQSHCSLCPHLQQHPMAQAAAGAGRSWRGERGRGASSSSVSAASSLPPRRSPPWLGTAAAAAAARPHPAPLTSAGGGRGSGRGGARQRKEGRMGGRKKARENASAATITRSTRGRLRLKSSLPLTAEGGRPPFMSPYPALHPWLREPRHETRLNASVTAGGSGGASSAHCHGQVSSPPRPGRRTFL